MKKIFPFLILMILSSCFQKSLDIVDQINLSNYYQKGQKILFVSDEINDTILLYVDTVIVNNSRASMFPSSNKAVQQGVHVQLSVKLDTNKHSGIIQDWLKALINTSASWSENNNRHKDTSWGFELRMINWEMPIDHFNSFDKPNKQFTHINDTIAISGFIYKYENDISQIDLNPVKNQFYWNKKYGLIGFRFKDHIYWLKK